MPDTESARNDMRTISKYLDQYRSAKDIDSLSLALRYVGSARQHDRTATLQLKENGKVILATIDSLEAATLCYQGAYFNNSHGEAGAPHAIELLERSLQLNETKEAYILLSAAYNANFERDKAIAVLEIARKRFPENFEIQSARDRFITDPQAGVKPQEPTDWGYILAITGAVVIIASLALWSILSFSGIIGGVIFGGALVAIASKIPSRNAKGDIIWPRPEN